MPSLSLSHVCLAWPDGRRVFDDLSFSLPPGLSGIVGRNGIGKSTLLRLCAGVLVPDAGQIVRPASLAYVPQDVTLAAGATVADVLGIADIVAALRAIEDGSVDPRDYDRVGDEWAIEERAAALLASLGLPAFALDRRVGEVSGGEAMLLAVGAALLTAPEVLLLDEPSNNLDGAAREALGVALAARDGSTALVTHDRALLEGVDRIGELRERPDRTTELRWFGGALDAFEEARALERSAAEQAVASVGQEVARQKRELRAHVEGAGAKRRQGEKAVANRRFIGGVADAKRRQAQETEARVRRVHEARIEASSQRLEEARASLERDRTIRVDLPGTVVPPRKMVLRASGLVTRTGAQLEAIVQGPERIHLAGSNGAGKSTLVETLLGTLPPVAGDAHVAVPVGYLRQSLDVLDDSFSVVDNVRRWAPSVSPQEVRDLLGRFQFRGTAADALAGTLSGGERFRAALACVLLARPEPQLLVLDEPTNNLDFASQAHLVEALEGYGGALLVISHDDGFVEAVAPTRRWVVDGEAGVGDVPLG